MVCTEPLTLPSTLLTGELSLCSTLGHVLTMIVNTPHALASLTLTVNSGFALTTVNTVNKWHNSWFFNRTLVDGDR
jgi:hypothetical protein